MSWVSALAKIVQIIVQLLALISYRIFAMATFFIVGLVGVWGLR